MLTFDYNFQWALKIAQAKNKDEMRETISKIVATGNTNIYPALREAYEQLKEIRAKPNTSFCFPTVRRRPKTSRAWRRRC